MATGSDFLTSGEHRLRVGQCAGGLRQGGRGNFDADTADDLALGVPDGDVTSQGDVTIDNAGMVMVPAGSGDRRRQLLDGVLPFGLAS